MWTKDTKQSRLIEQLLGFPRSERVATHLAVIEPSEWFVRVLDLGRARADRSTVGYYKCLEWDSSSRQYPVQCYTMHVFQVFFSGTSFLGIKGSKKKK